MASDAVLATPAPQLRLHPWSWLFVLLAQLRSVALPLLALLLFGRGDGWQQWELLGALAGGALALASVVQYFSYRYGVIGSDLVIRAGILNRNTRTIPLARIRNVSLHRNVLHRLFGVAEVRLESAGGTTAEAHMRVLSLPAAAALERLVQVGHGQGAADADAAPAAADLLLALPTGELVRLGVISNRGIVVVGAALAALSQTLPGDPERWIRPLGRGLFGQANMLQMGWLGTALAALALLLAALLVLRLLSVALAIVQFHGFTLRERDGTLGVESGLLTRVRAHAPVLAHLSRAMQKRLAVERRRASRALGLPDRHLDLVVVQRKGGVLAAAAEHLAAAHHEDVLTAAFTAYSKKYLDT